MAYVKWNFQTKGKGDIHIKFFQYSNSKRVHVQPDIVEYNGITVERPLFDLILGANTMDELGIMFNFKQKLITIDEIELPMTSINTCLLLKYTKHWSSTTVRLCQRNPKAQRKLLNVLCKF